MYLRENLRHFSQRQTNTWLQLGQLNLEAFSPGMMGRLQDVQTGSATDLCDNQEGPSEARNYTFRSFPRAGHFSLEPEGRTRADTACFASEETSTPANCRSPLTPRAERAALA